MIGKAIAGWIGSSIDRRDGEGGTLGAVTGVAVYGIARRVLPAAIVLGAAAYGAHWLKRRMETPA